MMNKLPAKQIYLLSIIVIGIIALSVYSTYAIFTFESSTSNIVSIHTPNTLNLSTDTYQYKQVTIPKNAYITTDVDIYNNFNYELCYSIWYKIITNSEIDISKVKIYQNTSGSLTTSGTIAAVTSERINLMLINDNYVDVKIKIGLAYTENNDTCALNISKDKSQINATINNPRSLGETIIKNTNIKNNEAGYLTYKDQTNNISLPSEEKIYVSDAFNYSDELFTLKEAKEIEAKEIGEYVSNDNKNYYTCLNSDNCRFLYHIIGTNETEENNIKNYLITKYDILVGYLAGETGLRKITSNNTNSYIYYGDNPNNFIYYNCTNELDTKTCELWRIMGFIYSEEDNKYLTKIIKDESIGTYQYSSGSQAWKDSEINKYFEKEYKLLNTNYLKEITFKQANIIDLTNNIDDIDYLSNDNKSKVTIMSLSDYLNASVCEKQKVSEFDNACLNNNWLNNNSSIGNWTTTVKYLLPYEDEETEEIIEPENNTVYSVGATIEDTVTSTKLNVRPIVYLNGRVLLINGEGTLNNPYVIR